MFATFGNNESAGAFRYLMACGADSPPMIVGRTRPAARFGIPYNAAAGTHPADSVVCTLRHDV